MITSADMYRRALRVVADLERRVKDGTATEADRARYQAGIDHVLIYDWSRDSRPAVEVMPALPPEPLDPRVLAFCNWWERVHTFPRWAQDWWRVGLLYWWYPLGLESLTWELESAVEEELILRDAAAEARGNAGMVVTDLDTPSEEAA